MADKMQVTGPLMLDCVTVETLSVATSECDEGSEDTGVERARPLLSAATLRAHEELMSLRKEAATCFVPPSSDEAEAGSDSSSSSVLFLLYCQRSSCNAASELRLPLEPHGAGECDPCYFFARGICRQGNACKFCHEHQYERRPAKRFTSCGRSLQRSSEEVSPKMLA